jgi:hypothetical protein
MVEAGESDHSEFIESLLVNDKLRAQRGKDAGNCAEPERIWNGRRIVRSLITLTNTSRRP